MYWRESRQKRADGCVVTHLQLAESTWNPQKKRSEVRIVYNCGRAENPQSAERLRKLAQSILKNAPRTRSLNRTRSGEVAILYWTL